MDVRSVASNVSGFGAYTVVDVETTGLDPEQDRIVSIAALTLGPQGDIQSSFHTLVDPQRDPGATFVHGLTAADLRGAPTFAAIRTALDDHLRGRTMVAHNAAFDYRFLAAEYNRLGSTLPVPRRLCTLALANRVAPPTPDNKLASLAAYYGVAHTRVHDAVGDTRALAGVLRALIADAATLGVPPPLLDCGSVGDAATEVDRDHAGNHPPVPRAGERPAAAAPRRASALRTKRACPFRYPGRFDGRLVQGMKVAFTGGNADRADLIARATEAGLDPTGSVSRLTSLLVTDFPESMTGKAIAAAKHGTPIVGTRAFLALLAHVADGAPKAQQAEAAEKRPRSKTRADGPLAGRRILILGGTHDEAAVARQRVVGWGASAAVNLTATVTDVVALDGAAADSRLDDAIGLGLPIHTPAVLATGVPDGSWVAVVAPSLPEPVTIVRGEVVDLRVADDAWMLRASWVDRADLEIDVIACVLDDEERVGEEEDFVFYNQPDGPGVRLAVDSRSEQSVAVTIAELPSHCRRVVVAAVIEDDTITFGDVGAVEFTVSAGAEGAVEMRSTLDAATDERTLLLAEFYRRGEVWRIRSIGQGYATGLAELAVRYGVEVDE